MPLTTRTRSKVRTAHWGRSTFSIRTKSFSILTQGRSSFHRIFGVVLRSDADRMPEERLLARSQSTFQRLTGAANPTRLTGAANPTRLTGAENPIPATRQTPSSMKCTSEVLPREAIPECPRTSGEHLQELLRKFPISKSLELQHTS